MAEMNIDKERILDKLAKILTLANGAKGTPEGDAARRMLMREMAKHSIKESEIDLEKGKGTASDYIFEDEEGWEGLNDEGGMRQWVSALAGSIASTFGGRVWINPMKNTIHFLATAGDLETCLYFMDVIYSHIEKAARKECKRPEDWKKRNIFGQAAWQEVSHRLYVMKQEMDSAIKEYSGGTEVMIVKNDLVKKTVDDLFKERGFGVGKSNWLKSSDQKLMDAGKKAGRTAPLHRGIEA